ncbi:MAG TPA: DUF4390 domain-containing protein [Chromatiales bacterium]|jgi:hypothetical protein|nr:DUF4390 domain-containing protein [Chromatiaceae bacterium]HIN81888.1 DUF4390 domain-containing protein [Chromatiales bacterium]HIO14994.1 DUF4390 domain-containing protein [Chromatiales bacterium]HIO54096.1 DUF4390 domain-containing protein [Chromatiales bacterium]
MCSLLALLPSAAQARPGEISVESATTRVNHSVHQLYARVNYSLPDVSTEALHNGVPLTFVVEAEVIRHRSWVWDETIETTSLQYRLRYHALSESYQLINTETGNQRSFRNLATALRELGNIQKLPLVATAHLLPDERHSIQIRALLDIEALPLPLRSVAYMSPDWHVSSDWYVWQPERTDPSP